MTQNKIRFMLLGETGSGMHPYPFLQYITHTTRKNEFLFVSVQKGKSTFVNYLTNYFLGGNISYEKQYTNVRIVIPNKQFPTVTDRIGENNESNVNDQTVSQTSKPSTYKFVDTKNFGVNVEIIDTPGLADTRKSGQDDENIKTILNKSSELDFIPAIVLIVNGSHAGKTTKLKYFLNKLEGTVPDSLLQNLIVVLTNCDENSCNFDLKMLNGLKPKHVLYMQNNAFSSGCDRKRNNRAWQKLVDDWTDSMKNIAKFLKYVCEFSNVSADDFKKMIVIRQELLKNANEIILKQTKCFQVIDIVERREQEIKIYQERADQNKDFKQSKQIQVWELEKADYFSTVCQTHYKEQICHEKCGLRYRADKDKSHFIQCAAHAGNGECKQSSCEMSDHYHTYEIPKQKTTTTEIVLNEMKAIYDDALRKKGSAMNEAQANQALKDELLGKIADLKKTLIKTCFDLKSICKNFNFHEDLRTFIENLHKEASISHNFRLQK